MEYKNEPFDFVARTKENLISYCGPYKATFLLNSTIGLLFIAIEKYADELKKSSKAIPLEEWGLKPEKITICKKKKNNLFIDEEKNAFVVGKHIRNSFAHGHFSQIVNPSNNRIVGFKICDYDPYPNQRVQTFEADYKVKELKDYLLFVAEFILCMNGPQPIRH